MIIYVQPKEDPHSQCARKSIDKLVSAESEQILMEYY